MKYGFVCRLALGASLSFGAASAFAMDDMRSLDIPGAPQAFMNEDGDLLEDAFGVEAMSAEADDEARGREALNFVTTVQDSDLKAFNAGNTSVGDTGHSLITDGAFSNSTFGQAAVVSGNNNNVQMNTTINVNLF